jgi:hypothetical protein
VEVCAEHQINLIKVDDEKLGDQVSLCKTDGKGNPVKRVVAVVGWLRTMAKNLRPRMSWKSTSNARSEQIKILTH